MQTASSAEGAVCTKKPKVSVIIPVYKVEPWLRKCMDSVINQTLKEIEIICVDDGSPDNCGKILDEYASKDNRITVIHQENKGLSGARNSGLELAHGEYITFVDSDDYLNLNEYEVAYELAKKDDVDILQFGWRQFTDGKDVPQSLQSEILDTPVISNKTAISKISPHAWNKLFKAELIQKSKLMFLSEKKAYEDVMFSFSILAYTEKIKIIQTKMYNYRIRPGSILRVKSRKERFLCRLNTLKPICDEWRNSKHLIGNEHLLLTSLLRRCIRHGKIRLQYAKEILAAFGDDIYNPNVIKKCPNYVQKEIKKLKMAANTTK